MRLEFNPYLTATAAEHRATHRGMAHFAGTGPVGATCGGCANYVKDGARLAHICRQARRMNAVSKQHIPAEAAACRYFEVRT